MTAGHVKPTLYPHTAAESANDTIADSLHTPIATWADAISDPLPADSLSKDSLRKDSLRTDSTMARRMRLAADSEERFGEDRQRETA